MSQLHVVTFNVEKGKANRKPAPGRNQVEWQVHSIKETAHDLAGIAPDILALQEVKEPVAGLSLLDEIAKAGNYADVIFLPQRGPILASLAERLGKQHSGYGVALASKYPIRACKLLSLPRSESGKPSDEKLAIFSVKSQQRVVILAEIAAPEGSVFVAVTHLTVEYKMNRLQLDFVGRQLEAFARERGAADTEPRIILGDLNMKADRVRKVVPYETVADVPTFPVFRPDAAIDQITGRNFTLGNAEAQVMPISDHRLLRANVIFRG